MWSGVATCTQGKVRDFYDLGDLLVLITTDRQTAFDRLLATVPYKGQVLNQTSTWWFNNTTHICKNALLATPDPNVAIMRKLEVIPVEFIMRGYLTGSTETSIWTHYKNGSRNYCGNELAEGAHALTRPTHPPAHPSLLSQMECGDLCLAGTSSHHIARWLLVREDVAKLGRGCFHAD
jgi:phosphoribosylaminoimidazole-succinocarboxamide synthase